MSSEKPTLAEAVAHIEEQIKNDFAIRTNHKMKDRAALDCILAHARQSLTEQQSAGESLSWQFVEAVSGATGDNGRRYLRLKDTLGLHYSASINQVAAAVLAECAKIEAEQPGGYAVRQP
jgi:hypothetical protein